MIGEFVAKISSTFWLARLFGEIFRREKVEMIRYSASKSKQINARMLNFTLNFAHFTYQVH